MGKLNSAKTKMRYNSLGAAGVQVSELSFGCMTFNDKTAQRPVDAKLGYEMMKICFEHGINFFDNAEAYGGGGVSERIMGDAIRMGIEEGTWERMDLVVSTKIFFGGRGGLDNMNTIGLSRKHLYEGLKASLDRMHLDYVDLVFCHRPDPKVRIEETVRGMNHLIDRGMCFYWGTSEWSAQQLTEAIAIAERLGLEPPMYDQCQYSLIERGRVEVDYAPLYPHLGTTIWSPLAGGALTGKYKEGDAGSWGDARYGNLDKMAKSKNSRAQMQAKRMTTRLNKSFGVADRIRPIADRLECSVAQLAIAWAANNPHVSTVILGATRLEQLHENIAAIDVIDRLTPEIMKEISDAADTEPPPDEIMASVAFRKSKL